MAYAFVPRVLCFTADHNLGGVLIGGFCCCVRAIGAFSTFVFIILFFLVFALFLRPVVAKVDRDPGIRKQRNQILELYNMQRKKEQEHAWKITDKTKKAYKYKENTTRAQQLTTYTIVENNSSLMRWGFSTVDGISFRALRVVFVCRELKRCFRQSY